MIYNFFCFLQIPNREKSMVFPKVRSLVKLKNAGTCTIVMPFLWVVPSAVDLNVFMRKVL